MWLHLALVGLCLTATPADQAAELVKQLGSPRFEDRKAAEEGLLRLGPAALPAVRAGLKSDDAEVRSRCRQLAPRIEVEDRAQRADAYAADVEGKGRHDLPLREEYEKLAGTGPAARRLFAEMVRADGRLLQMVAADRARGRDDYQAECRALYKAERAAGAGQLAALLLVSLVLKEDHAEWTEQTCFAHLLGNPGLAEAMRDRKLGQPLGRLLLEWADRQDVPHLTSPLFFLYFVYTAEWKDGLPVVRRLIRSNDARLKVAGMAALAKAGGKAAAAELEKLWDDETTLFGASDGKWEAQLRDQALAASMQLAGTDPQDHRMKRMNLTLKGPPRQVWSVPFYGFTSDADRQAALKKWKARKE
jgi:hypothetical protein